MICPDFSTILEIDEKVRGKIFSQLRRIYDGQLRREFGTDENLDEREWKGRITLLAGATPEVDRYHKVFAALGDRFLRVRWPRAGGVEAALIAMEQDTAVSARLKKLVHQFLLPVVSQPRIAPPKLSDAMKRRIGYQSEFVALARSYVPRSSDREIDGTAQAESNTRLPQELAQIGRGWAVLMNRSEVDEEGFGLIRRAAWDSIPPVRRAILEALIAGKKPHSIGLPLATTDRALEELGTTELLAKELVCYFPPNFETEYSLSEKARELLAGADGLTNPTAAAAETTAAHQARLEKAKAWLTTRPKDSIVTLSQIKGALGDSKVSQRLINGLIAEQSIVSQQQAGQYKVR